MIRVLHLIHWLNVGGVETFLISLLRQIPRDEITMDIFCNGRNTGVLTPEALSTGARLYHGRLTPLHVGFARKLSRTIREGRYDILHNHAEVYGGLPVWIARRCGVKVISSFANTILDSGTTWSHWPGMKQLRAAYGHLSSGYAINHSDIVTAWSLGVLEAVVPDHARRLNCEVLHSGAALNDPPNPQERAELRGELGLPSDIPLVLHVGRFCRQKNHLGMLAIFKEVLQSVPNARLILVGVGPLFEDTQRTISELGLNDRVLCLGVRKDAARLMRCADVFLLPSFYEGLPMVGLEALSSYLPIVASDIAGVRNEIVREGETGLLRPVTDVSGLAAAVVRILTEPELAHKIALAGRRLAESDYTLEAAANRYKRIYQKCLQSPRQNIAEQQAAIPKTLANLVK
ncbi:MAG TPA: glycosyltransferase [Pirellulales bacterium]|nr:glycosyltransferase [Pirellulales bacterium]